MRVEAAEAALALCGVAGLGAQPAGMLSTGQRRLVELARALAGEFTLFLLDEPSSGLDPISSAELDALIRFLSADFGITFVVVTHELQSTYAIADRCILLDARTRTIIAEGTPADLRDRSDNPTVRRFFRRERDPQGEAS